MTAIERPAATVMRRPTGLGTWLSDGWATTKRNLIKIKRVPDVLVFTTLQPIMFVLLFTYVYEGVIDIPGISYTEFIMAGIFAQTVVFGSTWSGSVMAQDLKDGIIDRFRTLPMNRSAVLIGRTNGDLVINSLSMIVMIAAGLIVGWRITTSLWEGLAGIGLLLLFGYAFSWVMAFLGMSVRSPEVINNAAFLVLFPLTFLSNAFVPAETLPPVLQTFAEYNPVSALVQSARELFGNVPPGMPEPDIWTQRYPIATVLIGVALMLAIFVPLGIRKYGRVSTRA